MDQPLDAFFHLDECTEVNHARDHAFDQLVNVILLVDDRPGLRFETLHAQPDSFAVPIHIEHLYINVITDLEHFARMLDTMPGQLRYVDQSIGATQIDEGAEVAQAADHTTAHIALFQLFEQPVPLNLFPLPPGGTMGEDEPPATAIHFDYFQRKRFANHVLESRLLDIVGKPARNAYYLGRRQKPPNLSVLHDKPALVVRRHLAFPHLTAFHQLLGACPIDLCLGAANGEQQIAISIARPQYVDRYLITDLDVLQRLLFQPVNVTRGHNPLLFDADINQYPFRSHGNHYPGKNISTPWLVEIVLLLKQRLHARRFIVSINRARSFGWRDCLALER